MLRALSLVIYLQYTIDLADTGCRNWAQPTFNDMDMKGVFGFISYFFFSLNYKVSFLEN